MTPRLHVYCSGPAMFPLYNSIIPFPADTIEFNTIPPSVGYWDTTQFRYVAVCDHVARFDAEVCWSAADGQGPSGSMALKFFRNGVEVSGKDQMAVPNPYGVAQDARRSISLKAGDYVDVRPWSAFGGPWSLAPSTAMLNGQLVNTQNFIEVSI